MIVSASIVLSQVLAVFTILHVREKSRVVPEYPFVHALLEQFRIVVFIIVLLLMKGIIMLRDLQGVWKVRSYFKLGSFKYVKEMK